MKSVLSGDSLILAANANLHAPEKLVVLSGIVAPRTARSKNGLEEVCSFDLAPSLIHAFLFSFLCQPYGWLSREFLRQRCIGKQVQFQVVFTSQQGQQGQLAREVAVVVQEKEDLSHFMVANGWAKVKSSMLKDPNGGGRSADLSMSPTASLSAHICRSVALYVVVFQ